MRKKLIIGVVAACSVITSQAQYSITNYQSITSGITENYPVDVEFNPYNRQYVSLHSNTVGMSVINFDGASGNKLSSLNFFRSGTSYNPVKILHNGTDSYLLFSFLSGSVTRFAICKYNNASNAIQWARCLSYAAAVDAIPADMALDPSGNVYVLGSFTSAAGDQDLFISEVSTAGAVVWYQQYANTTYNESPCNITYDAASNEFTIGGTAIDAGNWLNRNALVWRVNTSGTIVASNLISFASSGPRLNSACAKRNGKYVYLTATSIVGSDGAGPFIVAKLAFNTLLPVTYNVYMGPTYFNPEFNFTNTNADLVLSGSASFVNTSTPGMANVMFALATCTLVSESRYTVVGSFAWGGAMSNGYASTFNELGSVINDPNTSGHFYFVKSRYDGYTSCDAAGNYFLQNITLANATPVYQVSPIVNNFAPIKLFSVQAMSHEGVRSCSYTPCPLCQLSTHGGTKSVYDSGMPASLNVYPNPASEQLNITTDNDDKGINVIEVYDMSGRLILSQKNTGAHAVTFAVDQLEKAVYILKLTYDNGSVDVKRFTKE